MQFACLDVGLAVAFLAYLVLVAVIWASMLRRPARQSIEKPLLAHGGNGAVVSERGLQPPKVEVRLLLTQTFFAVRSASAKAHFRVPVNNEVGRRCLLNFAANAAF